jgi:hypothetical protein
MWRTGVRDDQTMIVALVFNDLLLFGAGLACAYLHLTGRRS